MKLKYAYILAVTVLIACLALFAACDTTQQVEPPVQYDLSFSADGIICRTIQISGDEIVTLQEAPAKEGYLFNGWFFDEGTWTQLFYAEAFKDKAIDHDVTVYAKYTPVKYAVNYLPNGVLHDSVTEYTIEQQAELKAATREHYDFVGWFTDEACTQQIYEIAQGTTGNLTLYAKFVPTEYKAIFMDGESVVAEIPYTVETESIKAPAVPEHAGYAGEWEAFELVPGGIKVNAEYTPVDYKITYEGVKATEHKNPAGYNATELPLLLLEATREHYTFVGWYSDAELTKAVTEIAAGTVGDLTLYAKFVPIEYKATFVDGESVVAEIVYTVETESIETPAVPEHEGFAGKWEKFELTPGGITVKAEYTEIDYTITYEGVMPEEFENPAGYKVTDEAIVLNDATRQYYKFDGWYTDAEYTNRLTEIATGTVGDLVLYAKWTPVEYTVIYLDGDTVVAEVVYTVETESVTDPEVPVHPGYTGAWEAYELVPGGMTVNALYEIITYTVTYENTKDVLHGNPLEYVVTDETVVLADLAKDGYVFEGWYAGDVRVTEIAQGSTGDVVLTARWTPIVYNVKLHFDPAWGKYAEGIKNPVTFTVEDTMVLEKLVCLIPGYVFDGWYTEKNVGEGGEIRELIAHVGDVELYAHFVPEVYTITYVGAEGATNVNPGMYTIESQAINLLPASKEGYIFGGWYLDEALSIPASLLIPEGSMGDMTLYTKWTPVTYTIEYDADGGVLPENPVVYNITQTLTLQAPTKAGYVFKGWYMAVEQKDELENGDENEIITEVLVTQITPGMTGNLKLVARWTPIYYSITYHLYGGENPQMSMSDLLAGNLTGNLPLYTAEVPMIPLFPATKPGYKFEGWYSDPTYTSRVMMIQTSECKDVVLYAKWSLMTYKIEYVLPESAEHENIDSYTVLDGITVLLPATMPGYTFDGWYKDPEFKNVVTHIAGTGEYGDVTLYPKFVPESYHIWLGTEEADEFVVIFNYNNEEEQLVTQTVSMNQGLVFPEVPVRAGYLFAGWYESADFTGDVFDFSVPVVGNVTLHAKWIEASSIISINTPVKVELNGLTEHKFTFVSLTNAVITIATEGDLDTRGTLCDADGKVLLTNDDASVTNKNFRIVFNAVAGKAYTIVVYAYSETIQGTVTLSVSGDTTVPAGGKAFLPNLFEVNSGENYHLPVPEAREGYKFLGWADVEGTMYTNGKGKSLKAWDGIADVVLHEVWEEMYYDVSFDTVGGSAIDSFKQYTGDTVDVMLLVPEKAGYRFLGWTLDGKLFTNGSMPDHAITLTAVWKEITYTITYENTKDVSHNNSTTYTITSDTIVLGDLSKIGYTFNGWYTDAEYTNRITEIAEGTVGNLILYAKWTPVEYTVIYLDGNTVVAEVIYTVETESVTDPEVPVHPGYTGAWEAYELVPGGMTVNALYEIITYTVTYENTKDVLHGNPLAYVVTDETVVLADLAKDGYIFEGWYAGDVRVTEIAQGSTGDVVLTAKWTPIVYNIKLHFDPAWGEYVDVTNPLTYTVEDSFELIDLKCLIPGYAFDGWYTEKNSATGEKKTEIVAGSIGDIELYASFALERYTITYVGVENADNSHNRSYYMIDTATFSISDINRPGYIFAGWYADEARTVPAALNVFKGSIGDITLYAKWITKTYTITYDEMGGSLPDNPTTYDITTSIVLAAPERPGYVFQGWYSDKIGGDMITEIQPGSVGNLTLYARWHAKQFSIQYFLEGGENAAENLTSYNITTKFSFAEPTKRGYKFAGWFTDDAYTEKISGIESGSVGNLTLYAKWELEEYTITYDVPTGVEHENELKKYTVETDATELLAASRNGYVFEGWYLDAKYTQAITQIPGIGLIGDLTLYAKFTPKQYYIWLGSDEDNSHTVTFELNGAGESFTQEVTMINGLAFPEIPVRDGYVFAGWFDNVACEGALFDFSLPVREDITLWAKWIETESFIKINAPVEVELNGVIEHKFTFVSLIDTVITVSTSGTLDTCGALYDAKGNVLLRNDDVSSADKNFQIIYQVTAGKEYTVSVYGFSNEVKGTTTLSVSGFATVPAGGKAFLSNLTVVESGNGYELSVPEAREGYKFLGWADAEGNLYTDAKGVCLKAWDGTADVVLVEKWEQIV